MTARTQAAVWLAIVDRVKRPRPLCTDRGARGILGGAAVEAIPVGASGWGWRFADGSLLVSTPEWEQVR